MSTTDTAAGLAAEARKIAEFLDSYPPDTELPTHFSIDGYGGAEAQWLIFGEGETQKARAAAIVKAIGGHWDKQYRDFARFKSGHPSGVHLEIVTDRDQVCP